MATYSKKISGRLASPAYLDLNPGFSIDEQIRIARKEIMNEILETNYKLYSFCIEFDVEKDYKSESYVKNGYPDILVTAVLGFKGLYK